MSSKIFGLIALTTIITQTKAPKNFLYNLLIGEEKAEKVEQLEIHTKEAGREKAPLLSLMKSRKTSMFRFRREHLLR